MAQTIVSCALAAALSCVLTLVGVGLALARKSAHKGREGRKRRCSTSKVIAYGVLFIDGATTFAVLYLCWLAITTQYEGALPYLTALIGALQFATGYVLGHYFKKATAENTAGGITYDAALGVSGDEAQG